MAGENCSEQERSALELRWLELCSAPMATAVEFGLCVGIAVLVVLLLLILARTWSMRQKIDEFAKVAKRERPTLTALGSLSTARSSPASANQEGGQIAARSSSAVCTAASTSNPMSDPRSSSAVCTSVVTSDRGAHETGGAPSDAGAVERARSLSTDVTASSGRRYVAQAEWLRQHEERRSEEHEVVEGR